jgi:anaerobic selenocysteine-containing dehydrogenase
MCLGAAASPCGQNIFPINREGLIPNPEVKKALGRDRFPVYSLYRGESHANALPEAVLQGKPYPIRSLIILGGSMITAWPQPEVWRQSLAGLDFLTCIDLNFTADCAYADLVLPAATWYEIESYMTYGPIFRLRERVIEPVGEARNAFFIFAELASRLGYGHLYPQNEDRVAALCPERLAFYPGRGARRGRPGAGGHRHHAIQEVGKGALAA